MFIVGYFVFIILVLSTILFFSFNKSKKEDLIFYILKETEPSHLNFIEAKNVIDFLLKQNVKDLEKYFEVVCAIKKLKEPAYVSIDIHYFDDGDYEVVFCSYNNNSWSLTKVECLDYKFNKEFFYKIEQQKNNKIVVTNCWDIYA